jgi:hypothetical protein
MKFQTINPATGGSSPPTSRPRQKRGRPPSPARIKPILRGAIRGIPVHYEQTNRGDYHGNDSR